MRLLRALTTFFTILARGKEPGPPAARGLTRCDQGRHGPWKSEQMDNWGAWDRETCTNCGYYEDNGHLGQFSRPFRRGEA